VTFLPFRTGETFIFLLAFPQIFLFPPPNGHFIEVSGVPPPSSHLLCSVAFFFFFLVLFSLGRVFSGRAGFFPPLTCYFFFLRLVFFVPFPPFSMRPLVWGRFFWRAVIISFSLAETPPPNTPNLYLPRFSLLSPPLPIAFQRFIHAPPFPCLLCIPFLPPFFTASPLFFVYSPYLYLLLFSFSLSSMFSTLSSPFPANALRLLPHFSYSTNFLFSPPQTFFHSNIFFPPVLTSDLWSLRIFFGVFSPPRGFFYSFFSPFDLFSPNSPLPTP